MSYEPDAIRIMLDAPRPGLVVLNEIMFPGWHVTVDGAETQTFMASPSLIGLVLEPGQHFVSAEYRSTPVKAPLLGLGVLLIAAELAYAWRAALRRWSARAVTWARAGGPRRILRRRLPRMREEPAPHR